jgi:hypothetical protein
MHIDFLYWSGCPSHEKAAKELRQAMVDLEIEPGALTVRQIETREEAVATNFPGSPTIRIDGTDIESTDEEPQLTCRVYHRRDGRISPTPDPADVREALAAARTTDTPRD